MDHLMAVIQTMKEDLEQTIETSGEFSSVITAESWQKKLHSMSSQELIDTINALAQEFDLAFLSLKMAFFNQLENLAKQTKEHYEATKASYDKQLKEMEHDLKRQLHQLESEYKKDLKTLEESLENGSKLLKTSLSQL